MKISREKKRERQWRNSHLEFCTLHCGHMHIYFMWCDKICLQYSSARCLILFEIFTHLFTFVWVRRFFDANFYIEMQNKSKRLCHHDTFTCKSVTNERTMNWLRVGSKPYKLGQCSIPIDHRTLQFLCQFNWIWISFIIQIKAKVKFYYIFHAMHYSWLGIVVWNNTQTNASFQWICIWKIEMLQKCWIIMKQ